jgi:hypothetical protein
MTPDPKPPPRTQPRPGKPGAAATPAEAHAEEAADGALTSEEKAALAAEASREEDA